jgi:hypothetical protein
VSSASDNVKQAKASNQPLRERTMTCDQHETVVRAERHVQSPRDSEEHIARWLHEHHDKDVLAVHLAYLLERMEEDIRGQFFQSLQDCQASKEPRIRERLAQSLYQATLTD